MKELNKLLSKAKVGLMMHGSVFLSTITFSVKHVFSKDIPTAGTDGSSIVYNPDYFKGLTDTERIFLLAHETWHIALSHMLRVGNRDKLIYNMAGDYVINLMLSKAGYTVIKEGLLNNKYSDWSTTQVYNDLIHNQVKPPPSYKPDILEVKPSTGTGKNKSKNQSIEQAKKKLENDIKTILVNANTQSKMQNEKPGSVPGEIRRLIDDLINPKLNWDELLHRFMDANTKNDYTWTRPNRRYLPDFYLPSQHSETINNITVAIDTSGSVSKSALKKMLSEVDYIREKYKPTLLTILDCDYKIHNIHKVTDPTISLLDLKFSGGGGTSFTPVFDYCDKHNTNILLYFTDLYGKDITRNVNYNVLWLCYSEHAPSSCGETIYYRD